MHKVFGFSENVSLSDRFIEKKKYKFGSETSANLRGEIEIQNTDIHLKRTASPPWTCRAARTFITLILHGHRSLINVFVFSVRLL